MSSHSDERIESLRAQAYTIPTEGVEQDGTFEWDSTTMVYVEVDAGGCVGVGYSYGQRAAAGVVLETLAEADRRTGALARGGVARDAPVDAQRGSTRDRVDGDFGG